MAASTLLSSLSFWHVCSAAIPHGLIYHSPFSVFSRSPSMALILIVQFSSVAQPCPTLWDPMNCTMPGLPVHYQLPEFTQTYVHRVSDAIQPSHPLSSPFSPAPNPSQHQSFPTSQLFAWGGQSTGVSALASFLPKNTQGLISFRILSIAFCNIFFNQLHVLVWSALLRLYPEKY